MNAIASLPTLSVQIVNHQDCVVYFGFEWGGAEFSMGVNGRQEDMSEMARNQVAKSLAYAMCSLDDAFDLLLLRRAHFGMEIDNVFGPVNGGQEDKQDDSRI